MTQNKPEAFKNTRSIKSSLNVSRLGMQTNLHTTEKKRKKEESNSFQSTDIVALLLMWQVLQHDSGENTEEVLVYN